MTYCGPIGLPHSQFLSWDPDDQDKAIAWKLEEMTKCSRCGTKPAEWMDDTGRAVEPPPYKVDSRRCLGCATLQEHRAQIPKEMATQVDAYLVPVDTEAPNDSFYNRQARSKLGGVRRGVS